MTKTPNSYGSNFARCLIEWIQFELNPRIETHGGEPGLKICKNFARPFTPAWPNGFWGHPAHPPGPPPSPQPSSPNGTRDGPPIIDARFAAPLASAPTGTVGELLGIDQAPGGWA